MTKRPGSSVTVGDQAIVSGKAESAVRPGIERFGIKNLNMSPGHFDQLGTFKRL